MSTQSRVARGTPVRGGQYAAGVRTEPQLTLFSVDHAGEVATPVVLHAVGFNDEQTQCDRCGRVELRGTVVLADHDGNITARMGTTCAGKTLGVQITRDAAVSKENVRRSNVAGELREAEHLVDVGRFAYAAQRLGDARRLGLHLTGEVTTAGRIDALVAAGLAARPQRWGVISVPGRTPVEVDTLAEATYSAGIYAKFGGYLVRMDAGQWTPAAAAA